MIHQYWAGKYAEKQEVQSSRWAYGDSPGLSAISGWIETGAKSIQNYQAVRWALSDLRRGAIQAKAKLKTTWTGGSGSLPESLELDDCQSNAFEMIGEFEKATKQVSQKSFESSLAHYIDLFAKTKFWQQKQYLVWFHGKDIQKAMEKQKEKEKRNANYISLKIFFNSAIDRVDITKHPDLLELKTKIECL